ncbi:hypothetical protein QBC34DRAFT_45706 [Podospora aff. communis PSN243]|uniref:Uncharacterized protein n=1 Tax=Podospora aff. communis PSN243 TaxID=3040156 RepID=A0AAV9GU70_9PEZI|nr:hypothetical protein QBC34DRAFT_45706 [Podospora aff. communis PSN243]
MNEGSVCSEMANGDSIKKGCSPRNHSPAASRRTTPGSERSLRGSGVSSHISWRRCSDGLQWPAGELRARCRWRTPLFLIALILFFPFFFVYFEILFIFCFFHPSLRSKIIRGSSAFVITCTVPHTGTTTFVLLRTWLLQRPARGNHQHRELRPPEESLAPRASLRAGVATAICLCPRNLPGCRSSMHNPCVAGIAGFSIVESIPLAMLRMNMISTHTSACRSPRCDRGWGCPRCRGRPTSSGDSAKPGY